MTNLCAFADIFGKPNTGLHAYRVFNLAIVDVVGTIGLSYLIYIYLNKKIDFKLILILMFMLGIVLHRLFCVRTTIDKLLFGSV